MTPEVVRLFNEKRYLESIPLLGDTDLGNAWKGAAFERVGKYEEAFDALKRVKSHNAQSVQVLCRVARHFGDRDYAIRVAEENIDYWSAWDLVQLYDEEGRYLDAWELAVKCNNTSIIRLGRKPHVFELNTQPPRPSCREEKPVFIVGMPRSGTTLLYSMLNNSDELKGIGENRKIPIFTKLLKDYPKDYGNLEAQADIYWDGRTLDKHPMNFLNLSLIYSIFPKAKVIHLDRDRRDVFISCYFRNFENGYDWSYCIDTIPLVHDQKDEMVSHFPVHTVRYEDLVTDQEAVLREVAAFCEIEWTPNLMDHRAKANELTTWSYEEVRKPLGTSSIGRWQNYPWAFDD